MSKLAKETTSHRPALIAKISQLAALLQIPHYDVLLIGDGSGSGWQLAVGWACTLLDRQSSAGKLFYGGINSGTISIGELLPYLHALTWYFSNDGPGKDRLKACHANARALDVHIVTDSEHVANCGNQVAVRHTNQAMWAAMDYFRTMGVTLTYHHWGRGELSLNILADEVARQSRLVIDGAAQQASQVLAKKYPGVSPEASFHDFFLWE